jgi:hypothetical protein
VPEGTHREHAAGRPNDVAETLAEADTDRVDIFASSCDNLSRSNSVEESLVLNEDGSQILLSEPVRELNAGEGNLGSQLSSIQV